MIKQLTIAIATIGLVVFNVNAQSEDVWDPEKIAKELCQQEIDVLIYNVGLPETELCYAETGICEPKKRVPVDFLRRYLNHEYGDNVPPEDKECINKYLLEVFSQSANH